MQIHLDDDAGAAAPRRYPVSELIRSYLEQSTSARSRPLGAGRPERPQPTSADDLWDYLGDFA